MCYVMAEIAFALALFSAIKVSASNRRFWKIYAQESHADCMDAYWKSLHQLWASVTRKLPAKCDYIFISFQDKKLINSAPKVNWNSNALNANNKKTVPKLIRKVMDK